MGRRTAARARVVRRLLCDDAPHRPAAHEDSPQEAGAEHRRPWYRSPVLYAALAVFAVIVVLALTGDGGDGVRDVPEADGNPLPVGEAKDGS